MITAEYIDGLLEESGVIRAKIRALIKSQLKADEVTGRNLVMENLLETYVRKTLTEDRRLMREKGVDRFRILGLEMKNIGLSGISASSGTSTGWTVSARMWRESWITRRARRRKMR